MWSGLCWAVDWVVVVLVPQESREPAPSRVLTPISNDLGADSTAVRCCCSSGRSGVRTFPMLDRRGSPGSRAAGGGTWCNS